MSIDNAFKQQLRDRVNVSQVIQRAGVQIKRNGREWKGCCPFHDEKTPSFTVNDEKGFYHCFGCGAHGDVISWLVDHDNLGFVDAIKSLAEIAGMEMPAYDAQSADRDRERAALIDLNTQVAAHFHSLVDHPRIRDYIANRGISPETAKRFELGYAEHNPSKSMILTRWPSHKEQLDALGLARSRDDGSVYDFFRDRLVIPIHDARGKVIGFGGRILGKGEPKYLNSPQTPVFDKGRTLFNLHRAISPARKAKRLIIVEGYMDVIGIDSVGIQEAVAPNGTALTEDHIRLAWRYSDKPIVLLDGDKAGRAAAVKAAVRVLAILEPGRTLRFAFPPAGKDPDDLAQEGGAEAVNAVIDASESITEVLWRDLCARHDQRDPDGAAALRREARDVVRSIKNDDVRVSYGHEFARLVGGGERRGSTVPHQKGASSPAVAMQDVLLLALLRQPAVIFAQYEKIAIVRWKTREARDLVDGIIELVADGMETPETLISALERQDYGHFADLIQRRCALPVPDMTQAQLVDMLLTTANPKRNRN